MPNISVEQLYLSRIKDLELTLLSSPASGMHRQITNPELHRPGLALAGFFERFPKKRIQIFGETEIHYLNTLSPEQLMTIAEKYLGSDIPLVFISKSITPPLPFLAAAERHGVVVISSRLTTTNLQDRLGKFLDHHFAPVTNVHGTLVDVYGVGLLYTGKSGIGKSEVALDLVERGHRLVADDVVKITRTAPDVIIGTGSELLGHHMEIRGVGIIDVEALFGIRAVRLQKRIEVEVHLTIWDEATDYERLGLEESLTTVLGVQIPILHVPIQPGKNITVISEVIAMNHMLKVYGQNSAVEFSRRLTERLSRQTNVAAYLESDTE